jgi:AraC family transcriptional regulator, regulatory protein of adaptative response / methylated-DNA-[protein]-cysteine methyltransferase
MEQLAETHGRDYDRVARAIRYITANRLDQPSLEEVADAMGLSPFHAQRVFTRWAGLSPKRFLGLLTVEHAKALLRSASESVMGAAYEVGLSGSSRLHDLFVTFEAITPGEHKVAGADLVLRWGVHHTPFGAALLVASDRGLARLTFLDGRRLDQALAEAKADWPLSRFAEDSVATRPYVEAAFGSRLEAGPLRLFAKGTLFQVQVWRALMRIPEGSAVTYSDLAAELGRRQAARAVGGACRTNRIGVLIPCHRVIRDTGALGGYQWGLERKQALLAWESARRLRDEPTALAS